MHTFYSQMSAPPHNNTYHHGTCVPTYKQRLESSAARAAYYAYWLHFATHFDFIGNTPNIHEIAASLPMCPSCGMGTGNFCNTCAGPLCNLCEDKNLPCPKCAA